MVQGIGIVGTGDIAAQFATQIDKNKYKIISVYNHREASLKKFVEKHHIENSTTNYEEFLATDGLEVVYIATPNQTHYEFAKEALMKKKHVLCEKVMVMEGSEAKELFDLAKSNQVVLLEGVTLFYMPMFETVRAELATGKIGKVSNMSVLFGSCKEYDPNNRFFSKELGGGALFDIGTYALSAAVYFLGTDLKLLGTDVEFAPTGVDEKSMTLLKNPQGEQASVMISFRGKMPKQIIITGDNGFVEIEDFPRAENAVFHFNDGTTSTIDLGHGEEVFTYELDTLNTYINEENQNNDLRETTMHVINLMDQMRDSWNRK